MSILYKALQKARQLNAEKISKDASTQDILKEIKKYDSSQKEAVELAHQEEDLKDFPWLWVILPTCLFVILFAGIYYWIGRQAPDLLDFTQKTKMVKTLPPVLQDATQAKTGSTHVGTSKGKRDANLEPAKKVPIQREVQVRSVDSISPSLFKSRQSGLQEEKEKKKASGLFGRKDPKIPYFRCTGILGTGDDRFCFLNGLIAREGDVIDGARVLQIRSGGVLIDYKGTQFEVPLPEI